MKRICINITVLLSILILASCSKEPKKAALYAGEPNLISFYGDNATVKLDGKNVRIPITRTSSSGEFAAPVKLSAKGKDYTTVFTIPTKPTFADGSAKTFVEIAYSDLSKIVPSALSLTYTDLQVNVGLAYPVTLSVEEKATSPGGVGSINIACSNELVFEDYGTAMIASPWAGEVVGDGQDADGKPDPSDKPLKLEKAKGVNVYRIYSPYGYKSIAFMIRPNGVDVEFPSQAIDLHPKYGEVFISPQEGVKEIVGKMVKPNQIKVDVSYNVSAGSFGDFTEVYLLNPKK